jgi:hypothetical protein
LLTTEGRPYPLAKEILDAGGREVVEEFRLA